MYVCLQHHCRNCGDVFCDSCTRGRTTLTAEPDAEVVRVCDRCLVGIHTWNHGFVCCGGGGPLAQRMMGGVKMILSVAQGTTTAQSFSCRSGKAFFLVCIP